MSLDLRALTLFCDLAETRSFSQTAERNFISQSAVSQRLRTLERDLGRVLLERGNGQRSISLTLAGQTLYEGAKRLLQEAAELEAHTRGASEEIAGVVRVATVYSVGLHAMPRRLKPFLAQYPRVNVHLEYSQTGRIAQKTLSGAVDVGIVACPSPRQGLEILPFEEETMALICAPEHRFARQETVALRQLQAEPFIAFDSGIPTRHLIDERLRAAGVQVQIVMEFDNIETIKNLTEIGSGVSLIPAEAARREAREGALAVRPLAPQDAFLRPTGLLVKASGGHRAAVRAFIETLSAKS